MDFVNARDLLLRSNRFDLFIKYLYLQNLNKNTAFYTDLYLAHEKAFNNFHEDEPSDGIKKDGPEEFLSRFNLIYENIRKNGFDKEKGIIPIGNNGEISDGAHRLAVCAFLNLDVPIYSDGRNDCYDYSFFLKRGLSRFYADYVALEYVKFNQCAYIVNLHSTIPTNRDVDVENVLNRYGRIFYKKSIELNYNGYVNIKKLSYGSFWERENWIGNVENKFAGAQDHAKKSKGDGKYLRAYVFVCNNPSDLVEIKKEVREIFNIGNYCIHINDHREEAIALAELYFNDNSLEIINRRPFVFEDEKFDNILEEFVKRIHENNLDLQNFCVGGSSPMNVLGIRSSSDLDYLFDSENKFNGEDDIISSHDSELIYYPASKTEIINNPKYYFYYRFVKFISIDTLIKLKKKRNEKPKDVRDIRLLKNKKSIRCHKEHKRTIKEIIKSILIFMHLYSCFKFLKEKIKKWIIK